MTQSSRVAFDLVTFDVVDTEAAARFWSEALGLVESEREDAGRWIVLSTPDGTRRIGLQRGDHRRGGVHLDLVCSESNFEAECERLLALGARRLAAVREEPYGWIANLADPEGNPFDLCAYR